MRKYRYEATSMSDAIALDVPVGLFERAATAFAWRMSLSGALV